MSVDQIYRRKIHYLPSIALKDKLIRISFSTDPTETTAEEEPTETEPENPDIV